MNSPQEDYKFYSQIKGIQDIAYFNLFEMYFTNKLVGQDKIIDIEDTDQESILKEKFGGYPIPGIIYTYVYGDLVEIENLPKKPEKYIDLVPLTFCLTITRDGFSGINLNLLPPSARLSFLDIFYDVFKDFLEREVDVLTQNNKLALNKKFINLMGTNKSQQLLKTFSKITSENFMFAFRRYQYAKIKGFRAVEFSQWKFVPIYNSKDAIKKLNLSVLYNLYNKSK